MAYPIAPIAPQLARTYEGSDFPAVNGTASKLSGGLGVIVDSGHQLDSPTTSGLQSLGVGARLPTVNVAAAGSLGILRGDVQPGAVGVVQVRGIGPATAAGSISAGQLLSICVLSGKIGWLQQAASGEEVVAQALVDAADGTQVLVRLLDVSVHP